MDCFAGSSTGVLKGISFSAATAVANYYPTGDDGLSSLDPKRHSITSMCFFNSGGDGQESRVLTSHTSGEMMLYDSASDNYTLRFDSTCAGDDSESLSTESASPISPIIKGVGTFSNGSRVVTAHESGHLRVWDSGDGSQPIASPVVTMNAGSGLQSVHLKVGDGSSVLAATGGKENPLKLWDLKSGTTTFTAKNLRADKFDLRQPYKISAIRFLNGTQQGIVATADGPNLRLYDPRVQRRPVRALEWLEKPLLALSTCCRDHYLLAGNAGGDLGLFDIRAGGIKHVCKFKGTVGAIRAIDAHPSQGYFIAGGLGRFVTLHELDSGKLVKRIYCKVPINGLLLRREAALSGATANEDGDRNGSDTGEEDADEEDEDSGDE